MATIERSTVHRGPPLLYWPASFSANGHTVTDLSITYSILLYGKLSIFCVTVLIWSRYKTTNWELLQWTYHHINSSCYFVGYKSLPSYLVTWIYTGWSWMRHVSASHHAGIHEESLWRYISTSGAPCIVSIPTTITDQSFHHNTSVYF